MRVAVIGAGMMGHGIAQVFLVGGHDAVLQDRSPRALETAPGRIRSNLSLLKIDDACLSRLTLEPSLERAVSGADIVFEAAYEDLPLKKGLFEAIEKAVPEDAVVASNTSVMSITAITSGCATAERMLGTHWWNPPFLIPLVEVVQTERTSPEAVGRMMDLLASVGKAPVHVRRDVPGFVGNRLQHALWREAFSLIDEGVCDAATVDQVIRTSFGLRLSVLAPVENADLVGLDLTKSIHEYVLPHLSRTTEPSSTLEALLADGKLGAKSGEGFLTWTPEREKAVREGLFEHLIRQTGERSGDR